MRTRKLGTLFGVAALLAGAGAVRAAEDVRLSGHLRYNAVLETAGNPASTVSTYEVTTRPYVLETVADVNVGLPHPLDVSTVDELCTDKDGCQVTLEMIDFDEVNEPGAVASATFSLVISETLLAGPEPGRHWRLDQSGGLGGIDNNDTHEYYQLFGCIFGDGETDTGDEGIADDELGFSLSKCSEVDGCAFDDETTYCRVVLAD